jgi:hypothetical protein
MRKLILNWLFGTDDVDHYMTLLRKDLDRTHEDIEHLEECRALIHDHQNTLDKRKEDLDLIRKLIRVCENHGIDVDTEVKNIKL